MEEKYSGIGNGKIIMKKKKWKLKKEKTRKKQPGFSDYIEFNILTIHELFIKKYAKKPGTALVFYDFITKLLLIFFYSKLLNYRIHRYNEYENINKNRYLPTMYIE